MNKACANPKHPRTGAAAEPPCALPTLSIVIPCHNEAAALQDLAAALPRLRAALTSQYQLEIILVDDGSSDATWTLLNQFIDYFGGKSVVRLVRHEARRGVAAAIATGLAHAQAEIVASLDADCTYDPLQLAPMLKLMAPNVDLVVASPYHPEGAVVGVASWRLALSRTASRLYRQLMHNKLHTYTSCVRVYRRRSVIDLPLAHEGFVGIVELVWQLDRRGGKIIECPAVLTTRKTGQSKMRTFRTAFAHLGFLTRAVLAGLFEKRPAPRKAANAFPA